jgi:hypothetical protein
MSSGQWAATELLISKGAQVSDQALIAAALSFAPVSVIAAMLGTGTRDVGCHAMYAAALSGHVDAVKQLLAVDEQSASKHVMVNRLQAAFGGAAFLGGSTVLGYLLQELDQRSQQGTIDSLTRQQILNEALQVGMSIITLQCALQFCCSSCI